MTPRVTNRVGDYQRRRAVALDFQEATHDRLIEQRLRKEHGHVATGFKAYLVRKTLTAFFMRDADRSNQ